MIFTWADGTPQARRQIEIDGPTSRVDLLDAVAKEIGYNVESLTHADGIIIVDSLVIGNIADGTLDRPFNNRLVRTIRRLVIQSGMDPRTAVWMIAKMVARFMKFEYGMTRAQFLNRMGNAFDAVTTRTGDDAGPSS